MDQDQGMYHNYFPSQGLPTGQWDPSEAQYQGVPLQPPTQPHHGGYYYPPPQQYQPQPPVGHLSSPHHQYQQQPYDYQTQPHFAANPQHHYPVRPQGQQPQPMFAFNQGQYIEAQSAGGPSQAVASPPVWPPNTAANPTQGMQYASSSTRSFSRAGAHTSTGSGGGSSMGLGRQYSGVASPQHHSTVPSHSSTPSGMSRLPAKPTFESGGGHGSASTSHAPPSLVAPGPPEAGSSSSPPRLVREGRSPSHNKRSSSMGHQLLEKLPPLPSLPAFVDPPSNLLGLQKPSTVSEEPTDPAQTSSSGQVEVEQSRIYLSSLLRVIEAYKAREEAMQLRIEALAFRPAESWRAISAEMKNDSGDTTTGTAEESKGGGEKKEKEKEEEEDKLGPAPVLGVRLLRKVNELQKENEQLGELLGKKLGLDDHEEASGQPTEGSTAGKGIEKAARPVAEERKDASSSEELETTRGNLKEAHELLTQISSALKAAEARAERAERALEAAVQSRSVGILG